MDFMYTILVVCEDILDRCYVFHSGGFVTIYRMDVMNTIP
jgi:hypothetical protein